MCLASVAFTYFLLDVYMRDVAPFWSQKETLAEYYRHQLARGECSPSDVLAGRDLLFGERNYDGSEGRAHGVRPRRRQRADEGMRRGPPRPARVHHLRTRPPEARAQLLPEEKRSTFKVLYEKNNKFSLAQAEILNEYRSRGRLPVAEPAMALP